MLKSLAVHTPAAAGPSAVPQWFPDAKSRPARLGGAGAIMSLWLDRGRSRRVLATLDDRQLRDIGLAVAEALRESDKPFWRA